MKTHGIYRAGLDQIGPARNWAQRDIRDDMALWAKTRTGKKHTIRSRAANSTSRRKVAVTLPSFNFEDDK